MEYVSQIIGFSYAHPKRALAPLGAFALHIKDHFIPHARNNYHPHLLGHRSLALMSALLVAVKIFTLSALSFSPQATAYSSAITVDNIITLTNTSREAFGLKALSHSAVLDRAAQSKAEDMLSKGYFSHNTPDGKTPWEFIVAAGYTYLMAGENLAVNFTEAENVEDAWMNSPGHKANILNKNFQEIGIGIAQGTYQGNTATFVVQMFGTPTQQKITLSNEPTPVQTQVVPPPSNVAGQAQDLSLVRLVSVKGGEVKVEGADVRISAEVAGPAVKVIAYFGEKAIMLSPKDGNVWLGQVDLDELAKSGQTVKIKAFNMEGESAQLQLADFSSSVATNYQTVGTTPPSYVTLFNKTFDPGGFEKQFYLMFMAGLLASLILAIAIKRHVQHLTLIAHSSFVIIFAAFLVWTG